MARPVPPEIASELQAQASPDAILAFLTIEHRNLPNPIRVVSDPIDFVIDGETYIGCPFEIRLLTDEDQAPTTQIRIQNVDRRIGEAVRAVTDRATMALEVRSTSDFNLSAVPRTPLSGASVIYGFRHFDLIDVTVNAIDLTGTLMLRDFTQEPYPGKRATQSRCPALFR